MSTRQIKVIGPHGQLSLGKEYAGKSVLIDQVTANTWVIKTGAFIPDAEQWLHTPKYWSKLKKALSWSEQHEPIENFAQFIKDNNMNDDYR